MKRVQTFLLLLLSCGFLATVTADKNASANNQLANGKLIEEIKVLNEKNREITDKYETEGIKNLGIDKKVVSDIRKTVQETLDLANLQTNIENRIAFNSEIATLKESTIVLNENYKKGKTYNTFLNKWNKKLLEFKSVHIKLCQELIKVTRDHLCKVPAPLSHEKIAAIDKSREGEKYFKNYDEFLINLRQFVRIEFHFTTVNYLNDDVRSLISKLVDREKTSENKVAKYVDIVSFCLLKWAINNIFEHYLYSTNYNLLNKLLPTVEAPNPSDYYFNIRPAAIQSYVVQKAIELEQSEYKTDKDFKDIFTIFYALDRYAENQSSYTWMRDIVKANIEEFQLKAKDSYTSIVESIKKVLASSHSSITISPELEHKIDVLLFYRNFIIHEIYTVIETDTYTNYNKFIKLHYQILKKYGNNCPNMTHPTLEWHDCIEWLGFNNASDTLSTDKTKSDMSKVCSLINPLRTLDHSLSMLDGCKWNQCIYVGFDTDKKDMLKKLERLMKNVDKMFVVLFEVLTRGLEDGVYTDILKNIEQTWKPLNVFYCIAKLNKLKKTAKYEVPPYILSTLDLLASIEENTYTKYPALNMKKYTEIENINSLSFILDENKARTVLSYLQSLIKQYNDSYKQLSEHSTANKSLVDKLCNVKSEDMNPIKTLLFRQKLVKSIETALNNIVNQLVQIKEINTPQNISAIQNNMAMFATALQILEEVIPKDKLKKLAAFTQYKKNDIQKVFREITRNEGEEETRKSKKAFMNCKYYILVIGDSISKILSAINRARLKPSQPVSEHSIQEGHKYVQPSQKSIYRPTQKPVLIFQHPQKSKSLSFDDYLAIFGICLLLLVIVLRIFGFYGNNPDATSI